MSNKYRSEQKAAREAALDCYRCLPLSVGIPSTSTSPLAKMEAPEGAAPFEPFSARSQHLGWLDLTFVEFDGGHALEDVDKDIESAFRVKPIDRALE